MHLPKTVGNKFLPVCLLFVGLLFQFTANGALEQPSAVEVKALERFRPLVADSLYLDYMKTDSYLLRWIRYVDFDLNRAANLIKTAHRWRRTNKIDSLLNEDLSSLEKMFPYDMEGIDNEGRPVWINYFGKWDVRKIALAGQIGEYNKFLNYQYEKIEQKIRDLDAKNPEKNITQFILIVDLQGYNLRQHSCLACIPGSIHFVNAYERYHAGSCFKPILINTPTMFESLLQILRPLMSARTRNDLTVLGFDQKVWQAELNKLITPENLPTKFGGTRQTKI